MCSCPWVCVPLPPTCSASTTCPPEHVCAPLLSVWGALATTASWVQHTDLCPSWGQTSCGYGNCWALRLWLEGGFLWSDLIPGGVSLHPARPSPSQSTALCGDPGRGLCPLEWLPSGSLVALCPGLTWCPCSVWRPSWSVALSPPLYPRDPSQAPDLSRVQRGLQTTRAPAEEGGQTPYPSFLSAQGPYAVWSLRPGARTPPLRLC